MRRATAASTTAAERKKAQTWRSALAWKWLLAGAPNPTTWRPVLWRGRCYVIMKVDFSPIFFLLQSLVLKPIIDCFSLYQESIWRFWFSRNYVFPAFSQFKISYPQPRSNAVYKSYGKSGFWGLHESSIQQQTLLITVNPWSQERKITSLASLKEVITTY